MMRRKVACVVCYPGPVVSAAAAKQADRGPIARKPGGARPRVTLTRRHAEEEGGGGGQPRNRPVGLRVGGGVDGDRVSDRDDFPSDLGDFGPSGVSEEPGWEEDEDSDCIFTGVQPRKGMKEEEDGAWLFGDGPCAFGSASSLALPVSRAAAAYSAWSGPQPASSSLLASLSCCSAASEVSSYDFCCVFGVISDEHACAMGHPLSALDLRATGAGLGHELPSMFI